MPRPPHPPSPPDPEHRRLFAWLRRHGARVSRVALSRDPAADRTVVATAPISADASVLHIPAPLLITTAAVRASAAGHAVLASGAELGDHTLFAAWLLEERERPRSRFRPYLDSLPSAFPTLPLSFSPAELALLQGTAALEKVAARRVDLARDHAALGRAVPALRRFSLGDFVWARACVITRVFGVTVADEKTEALVPLADMMNHARSEDTRWAYDDDAGAFVMTAIRDLQAGDPIHDTYGSKSNTRFLVNYGFTVDGNDEDDEAALRLAVPADAPLAAEKARLLDVAPGAADARPLPAPGRDAAAGEALSFLRVACATPRELDALARGPLDGHRVLPLNGRNESAALALLATECDEALRAFPTTLEEDDAILREGALTRNAGNAVVARRSEKRVLRRWIDLARVALPLLRLPRHLLARALDEGAAGDGDARGYLACLVAPTAPCGIAPPTLDGGGRIQ